MVWDISVRKIAYRLGIVNVKRYREFEKVRCVHLGLGICVWWKMVGNSMVEFFILSLDIYWLVYRLVEV